MKLPISTADRIDFTPDHYAGEDAPPSYQIKPLSLRDRAAVNRAVMIAVGSVPTLAGRIEYMTDNLANVVGNGIDEARAVLDDAAATAQQHWGDDLALDFERLHDAFMLDDAGYRRLFAAGQHWFDELVIQTVARGLLKWSGITGADDKPLALRVVNGGGDVDQIGYLPKPDLIAIFNRINDLSSLSGQDEKNSAPPLGSSGDQKTSKAAGPRQTAAKAGAARSRKKSTAKTPA